MNPRGGEVCSGTCPDSISQRSLKTTFFDQGRLSVLNQLLFTIMGRAKLYYRASHGAKTTIFKDSVYLISLKKAMGGET